jgi:hypothetical protein
MIAAQNERGALAACVGGVAAAMHVEGREKMEHAILKPNPATTYV